MLLHAMIVGLLGLLLTGCTGAAALVRALAKDPSTGCVSVQSPYASLALGRAARPGVKVEISGGYCRVEHALEAGP